jgi:hypothetical protein
VNPISKETIREYRRKEQKREKDPIMSRTPEEPRKIRGPYKEFLYLGIFFTGCLDAPRSRAH